HPSNRHDDMGHPVGGGLGWERGEAVLAGLLHDVGKLLLLKLAADYGKWGGAAVPGEELTEVLATEHASTGAILLRGLQFPRHLIEGVLWHHDPLAAPNHSREAQVIYF